jgi:hypothetical protein
MEVCKLLLGWHKCAVRMVGMCLEIVRKYGLFDTHILGYFNDAKLLIF